MGGPVRNEQVFFLLFPCHLIVCLNRIGGHDCYKQATINRPERSGRIDEIA